MELRELKDKIKKVNEMESTLKNLNVIDIGNIHKLFEILDKLDYRIGKIEEALDKENIKIK